MSDSGKIVGGFAWALAEKICGKGVAFLVSIVLSRLLYPEQYGVIAIAMIFLSICTIFVEGGFGSALVQRKDADYLDCDTVFVCSTAVGIVMCVVSVAVAPWVADFFDSDDLVPVLRVLSLTLLWSGYLSVMTAWITKRMEFKKLFLRTLASNAVSAVVGIAMAYGGYGVWALVGQQLTAALVGIFALQLSVDWRPRLRFSRERAGQLLKFGGNIMGASLIGSIFNHLKNILIGKIYTPADLALFDRGNQLPKAFNDNFSGALNTVLFSAMSSHSDDKQKVCALTRKTMRAGSFVSFFMMTAMFVVCEPFVRLVYTDKWIGCVPYMRFVCLSVMLEIISVANMQAMKAIGASNEVLKLEVYKKPVFLIMTVVGAYISVMALAVTLPLYSLYSTVVNMRPNRRLLGYGFADQIHDLRPAFLLAAVSFLVAFPIGLIKANYILVMVLQLTAFSATYFGFAHFFNVDGYCYVKSTATEYLNRLTKSKWHNETTR